MDLDGRRQAIRPHRRPAKSLAFLVGVSGHGLLSRHRATFEMI
jgi:hypothetical protein